MTTSHPQDEFRESWRNAETADQRLKWARQYWQHQNGAIGGTAEDAAASLGMKPGTYRAFERAAEASKSIALGHQEAMRFGRKFKVSWKWLLIGEGGPFEEEIGESEQRLLRLIKTLDDDKKKVMIELIEKFASNDTENHKATG